MRGSWERGCVHLLVVDRAVRVRHGFGSARLSHEHDNRGPELLALALCKKMLGSLYQTNTQSQPRCRGLEGWRTGTERGKVQDGK